MEFAYRLLTPIMLLLRTWPLILMLALSTFGSLKGAEPETVPVWPVKPPGETKALPPETNIWKPTDKLVGGAPIIKLTNVSQPMLTYYRPAPEKDTGAAIIICPGGGHSILAYDHEGTEVAEWLVKLGVTGIVLKYRVPAPYPDKRWFAAVQDAQRAVSVVRSQAKSRQIDPQRIGILGFSAGGETAGLTAIMHDRRQYEPLDEIDQASCRPDFAVLVYPAYFVRKEDEWQLREGLQLRGGKSFYTLLGAPRDFTQPTFTRLLTNALHEVAGLPIPAGNSVNTPISPGDKALERRAEFARQWSLLPILMSPHKQWPETLTGYDGPAWYRCVVRVPASWRNQSIVLSVPPNNSNDVVYVNGHKLGESGFRKLQDGTVDAAFKIPAEALLPGDANLLVVRQRKLGDGAAFDFAPRFLADAQQINLDGRWQFRIGDDPSWSNMPLPAKFGAPTDIVFEATK